MGKRQLIIPQTMVRVETEWAKKQSAYESRKNEQIEKVKTILRSHGIRMSVSGCGCCESPEVKFVYQGDVLIDDGNVNFDTEEDAEKNNA